MCDIKWRFPGNGYTADAGLDTADMETFKKDAISSLARELCQNSIDAKPETAEGPVKIVFNSFKIDTNLIPGRDALVSQIEACLRTWPEEKHKVINKQLKDMYAQITKPEITCLRISDFNTTGLLGVSGGDNKPWHYLVHGSGISNKSSTSGGSKGIGKFATFVTSHFNTVFYYTRTVENEFGFEGICKLCSAEQVDTDEKTQGIGYFGRTDKNLPIFEKFDLDPSFVRGENEYGTDIFILGFKEPKKWKADIISKILDSFMSAIIFETLQFEVDGTVINKETVKDIVYNDEIISKKYRKSIISQYLLLTDVEHRYEDVITIDGFGTATLYLLEFSRNQEDLATKKCVMIRHPYMKIKELDGITSLPCSAMCIIGKNKLNEILRTVENPQHTDWEFNRIEDPAENAEIRAIYKELRNKIETIIFSHLTSSDNNVTDLEGAEDYFDGDNSDLGQQDNTNQVPYEKPNLPPKKVKNKTTNVNASVPEVGGDGVMLDIGESSDEGEETLTPDGHNEGGGGGITPGPNPNTGTSGDDGHVLVKPAELRGMNYKFFCINKKERKYGVVFTSDYTEKEVTFELYALDESGSKYPVKIYECMINNEPANVKDQTIVSLTLKHGEKVKIVMTTDQRDLFSGEVKVYAYR